MVIGNTYLDPAHFLLCSKMHSMTKKPKTLCRTFYRFEIGEGTFLYSYQRRLQTNNMHRYDSWVCVSKICMQAFFLSQNDRNKIGSVQKVENTTA